MQLVNPGAEARVRREAARGLFDDQLKEVQPEREVRRREHADAMAFGNRLAARARAPPSPSCRSTTLIPRSASSGRFSGTASASVKSMATSTGPKSPSRMLRLGIGAVDDAGNARAVLGRERLDQLAHAPVTDEQQAHQPQPRRRRFRRKERGVQPRQRAAADRLRESRT